ncbi:Dipeptidyl peptidase 9 [Lamellibrachia satsuma]|nr:Dipeptidyl peptidase 9 [Lamellibrachia satsuma]
MGGKTTGVKERGVAETGGKEKGVGETGGKTTGVKERGVGGDRREEEGSGGRRKGREITKWIDEGSPVDIIYLDFQKAFDKVPHQRLLLKLKAHGIGDSITDWIEQWLTDRRQRVVMASVVQTDDHLYEDEMASALPMSHKTNKSWSELRQAVRKTRRLASTLLNRVPNTFTFRSISSSNGREVRLYYLGVPQGMRENTLLYVDVPLNENLDGITPQLEWKLLLEAFHATPLHGKFSKEELLLRERKRVGSFGITSYDYHEASGKFVFPACNGLYMCCDRLVDRRFVDKPAFPTEIASSCASSRMDPKLCPCNEHLLAYVSGNDLWVTNLGSGCERRLTFVHKGLENIADDPVSAGVPSFVVQEEFDRYTGYWWQSQMTDTTASGSAIYRILYEEVDETKVDILRVVSPNSEDTVDEYRYPRAGTPNAICTLKMLEFTLDDEGLIIDVVNRKLPEATSHSLTWMEYIVRAGWTPNGEYVYAQLLDRKQQCLQLVLITPATFCCPDTSDEDFVISADIYHDVDMKDYGPEGQCQAEVKVIYEDRTDIWLNVHDILHFFPQESPSEISFLWASEKTGFRHIYLVTSSLEDSFNDTITGTPPRPQIIKEVALTSGEWEVCEKQIWIDSRQKLVYFVGMRDTPLETHLYVVSYWKPGKIVRLTRLGYSHAVALDQECSMYVSVYSNMTEAPACHVYSIDAGASQDPPSVDTQMMATLLQSTPISEDYHAPELFSYVGRAGDTIHGMLYKPHELKPGCRYPTVLFVYGGPQVQCVNNSNKGTRFLRLHTLASLGYAVVVIDSRGSCRRGLKFESHIKDCLGTVEIDDQVEGLMWLASQVDFIDTNRVAIHGWSYGGYLSLMGLAQKPDIFKVAIAGAPVTSWNLYDTGYTERYMGLPKDNHSGYQTGSVLEFVDRFPSEENRLLIVHGLMDENVHFSHTSALINALIRACKPYQLQVYPNERHGIRNPEASEHYETMIFSFLQQNL